MEVIEMSSKGVPDYVIDPNVYVCDPLPQQSADQNRVYPFYEHLRENRLTTTECQDCGQVTWPPKIVCNECMSDSLKWVDFPPTGTIYAFTIQEAGVPPGYETPLVCALIDFDNGVRIISTLIDIDPDKVTVGAKVALKVVDAPRDRVVFFFTLV
jgi:uncharacterized OB-fold protein